MNDDVFKSKLDPVRQSMIGQDTDIDLFTQLFDICDNSYERSCLVDLMIESSSIKAFNFLISKEIDIPYVNNRKQSMIYKVKRNIWNYCRKNKSNHIFLARKFDFLEFVKNHYQNCELVGDEEKFDLSSNFFLKYQKRIDKARKHKVLMENL